MRIGFFLSFLVMVVCSAAAAQTIAPKDFEPPLKTNWKPQGCRIVPPLDDVLPPAVAWRNLHADEANTDEVSIALAPVFHKAWTVESATWNATGPVFDSAGNLYFAPLLPYENVALISLNAADGSRRFTIPNVTGAVVGVGTPMILNDPDAGPAEETVYLALYDRALALDTVGTVIWDVPTGLTTTEPLLVFGVNYAPTMDAIVGLTSDAYIYALDRRSGAPILNAPFQLPGEPSPSGIPSIPPDVGQCIAQDLAQFIDMSQITFTQILETLQGNGVEVANFFSIDAGSGDLLIAATAPDEEDGAMDGVSEFGALYKLAFVPSADLYELTEVCHASFQGGSASTPALRRDGTRVYVGDNVGNLIAIDTADCGRVWELDVGSRITGSIGVASDNNEIYVPTRPGIIQVIDQGDQGVVNWTSDMDAFDLPAGLIPMNMNLVSIGANSVAMQIGAGFPPDHPVTQGIAQLDRETGMLRWFAQGGDATVAVMSTGPDGALYIGNSGLRNAITNCLAAAGLVPFGGDPQTGGITKFEPARLDLLARDVVCAAADRALNASSVCGECPASAQADTAQILDLIRQADHAAGQAQADGDLSGEQVMNLKIRLGVSAFVLKIFDVYGLPIAEPLLRQGCGMQEFDPSF